MDKKGCVKLIHLFLQYSVFLSLCLFSCFISLFTWRFLFALFSQLSNTVLVALESQYTIVLFWKDNQLRESWLSIAIFCNNNACRFKFGFSNHEMQSWYRSHLPDKSCFHLWNLVIKTVFPRNLINAKNSLHVRDRLFTRKLL